MAVIHLQDSRVGRNVHDCINRLERAQVDCMENRNTVISSDECIAVSSAQLTIDEFLCLFECNVHVSIDRLKLSWGC